MKNNIISLAAACVFSITTQASCDFDDFPTLPEMKLFPIMGNATFNNRPMMVKGYSVNQSLQHVVSYYQREWKDAVDNSTYGPWYQVSTLTDDCMMTVQIAKQADDGAQGRLVISNVPTISPKAELGDGLMAPADAIVVSDLMTHDGSKKGRVSVLASAGSSTEVMAYYRSNMDSAGWVLEHSFSKDQAQVLVFRRGLKTSNVLIIPAGDITQILINEESID